MHKTIMASVVALTFGMPAMAAKYIATIDGVVTSTFATGFTLPHAAPSLSVGDRMAATFTFDRLEDSGLEPVVIDGDNLATFSLRSYTWTSKGDFLRGIVAPTLLLGADPMGGYISTMDDAGSGDLFVRGYRFEIGEFGYDVYRGFGFRGEFDRATFSVKAVNTMSVPEPATWTAMILGFAIAGTTLRGRRRRSPESFA